MSESIVTSLAELRQQGIIDEVTENRIREFYKSRELKAGNKRVTLIFGVLGSLLVGLGIILIVAHNWDHLSKMMKSVFAFLPLVIGQSICGYTLFRKKNLVWGEASSGFLVLATGACISLISQIYHIEGNLSSFLFTWMLLCLPVIYVMNSSVASLLFLIGITWYGVDTNYSFMHDNHDYVYWLFLFLNAPYVYWLSRTGAGTNFFWLLHLFIAISITIMLGGLYENNEYSGFAAYITLFGIFLLTDNKIFTHNRLPGNPYYLIGSVGSIVLLLIMSFNDFWETIFTDRTQMMEDLTLHGSVIILILIAGGIFILYRKWASQEKIILPHLLFIVFTLILVLGFLVPPVLSTILMNLLALSTGLFWLREGVRKNHLGIVNYGLLILAALVTCRFFDEGISFIIRGLMFVSVGILFFVANYLTIKKRSQLREHE